MNEIAASTNSPGWKHAWTMHPWVRLALYACLFAVFSGFAAYTVIRLRVGFANERAVIEQQATIDQLKRDHELLMRSNEERFTLLEQTVWGDIDPKLREALRRSAKNVKPEPWSVNRDRELRAKIINLERRIWFLESR